MDCKKTRNEEYAGGFSPGMEAFEKLTDPRNGKAKRHYFGEILFIALSVQTRSWLQKGSAKSWVPVSRILKTAPLPETEVVSRPS
jgi:hypothetical protein